MAVESVEVADKLLEAARNGVSWLRTLNAPQVRDALPYVPTSDLADAWLFGAWVAYWRGSEADRIEDIRRSRGHWFWLTIRGRRTKVRVTDPFDHRNGVEVGG